MVRVNEWKNNFGTKKKFNISYSQKTSIFYVFYENTGKGSSVAGSGDAPAEVVANEAEQKDEVVVQTFGVPQRFWKRSVRQNAPGRPSARPPCHRNDRDGGTF